MKVILNNNKYTYDFDNTNYKSINYINRNKEITDDVVWFYDTGTGKHLI